MKCSVQLTPSTPAFLAWNGKRSQQPNRAPTSQMFTYPTQGRRSCAAIVGLHGLGVGARRASCPWPQPGLPGQELLRGRRWRQGGSCSLKGRSVATGWELQPDRAQRGGAAGTATPPPRERQLGQVSGHSRRAGVLRPCPRLLLLKPALLALHESSRPSPGGILQVEPREAAATEHALRVGTARGYSTQRRVPGTAPEIQRAGPPLARRSPARYPHGATSPAGSRSSSPYES